MANIQARHDKDGKLISYSIRIHRGAGVKPYTATFKVAPNWTEASAAKKAATFAANFEKQCKEGTASDTRQIFQAYCEYVIELKEQRGVKHSTICRYRDLTTRIYPAIGHIKLSALRADRLNTLYSDLQKDGLNKKTGGKLSNKTIIEHHRLISTVLEQAVKEGLIPFNPASRTVLPKVEHKDVNYYQLETVASIRDALENEPIKWKTLVHLFLITGARRGELLGLKWRCVEPDANRVYICNNILYTPDRGIYEDTPKTKESNRYITLPPETMRLLREYKQWQLQEHLRLGSAWHDLDFVFTQWNGLPMHPDSVTDYIKKFGDKNGMPHLNPHAFRHTMVSVLYFNGVDSVSISKRLGHAQVSTTANLYAHVMQEADQRNADILGDIFLAKKRS